MIKPVLYILSILVTLFLFSCKKQENLNVKKLISTYSLESYGNYNSKGKKMENKWLSEDSTLVFTLYENLKTNHFLYLVQNKNRDTVFKYFDSTKYELKVRDFFKTKDNYFVTFWNPNLKKYIGNFSIPNGKNSIYESLFTYDSLNVYAIDSTTSRLAKIKKTSIGDIANSLKSESKLIGDFKAIKSDSEIRLIKDTLNNFKVCHKSNVGLEITIDNGVYILTPYFFNTSKIVVNKDNFELYEYEFLLNENLNGAIRYYYLYDSIFNNKGYSKLDLIFRQYKKEHVIGTSLEDLFDDKSFRNKYINNLTSLYVETFKYKDGQYFLRIYQDSEMKDLLDPQIFHLDTINWKIKKVMPFDKDKNYKKVKRINEIEIFSGIYKSNLYVILKDFEIVKVKDDYKLNKTN